MSLVIGRQGYFGIAIESVAGTPENSPVVFLPFTDNSLEVVAEKLSDISSRASRVLNHDSVEGRKWTEGDIAMYLDSINSGYLFKLAMGSEVKTQVSVSPAVDNHQFIITASGNSPLTATGWLYRGSGVSVKRTSRLAVNSLDVEITNDDMATMTASFIGSESDNVNAPSLLTTSGTVYSWANANVKFGSDVNDAKNQTATKLTNFQFSLNNNLEPIFRSGSSSLDNLFTKNCEVTGEYTLFFENDVHLDYYRNNTKRTMIVTLTGANLGGQFETLEIIFERIVLEDKSIETGQDSLFAITGTFRAINDIVGQIMVVNLSNGKTTVY